MEIICEKRNLLNAIHIVENAVSVKNTLPILGNILIEVKENKVFLTGTDLELTIKNFFDANIKKEGNITISAKKFSSIVKELPDGEINLLVDNGVLIISCQNLLFKIKGLSSDEFPSFPTFKQDKVINLKLSMLQDMIQKTIYAVSNDEIRYVLNGLYFCAEKNILKMVATDGHRLSYMSNQLDAEIQEDVRIIIPKKALHELSRISANLEDKDKIVEIKVSENQILFSLDSTIIISRLIEGQFPDYDKVIPKDLIYKIKINTSEFSHATKRISLMSNISAAIKYHISNNQMEIIAINPEEGEAKELLTIEEYTGEDVTIGYNYRYIMDILKVIDSEHICIEFNKPLAPGIIKVYGKDNFINVIMPMKIDKI